MQIANDELIAVLSQFNPWWRGEEIPDLPVWKRASFHDLFLWTDNPPAPRAVLLSGARQVGKTTLLLQVIETLLKNGVPASNIIYATFDHPIIKMAGIDSVLKAWREREPKAQGQEYLFLDEAQFMRDWGTWIKHQVDFIKNRRIVFTGSAMPLIHAEQESGVGRWHTIKLTTLSFYEYLRLKQSLRSKIFINEKNIFEKFYKEIEPNFMSIKTKSESFKDIKLAEKFDVNFEHIKLSDWKDMFSKTYDFLSLPKLPPLKSLRNLFDWSPHEFYRVAELAVPYLGHFHEYLVRGGFPQSVNVSSITQAQRLLREDIVDKILKRDMTALFGVRRVLELEQTFLYLCMHDSGLLDMNTLCSNLGVNRPTVQNFIELLEATHLIYRLQPFGYGKEILRAKYKIYLADAAIAPAVLLKGKSILENSDALGIATETAVFKHLYTHYNQEDTRFTYWRGSKDHEVDLIAETSNELIPFEIKYRAQHTGIRDLKGLLELCKKKSIAHAYVVTKSLNDFGLLETKDLSNTRIMRIPASLLCYWMGEAELSQTNAFD